MSFANVGGNAGGGYIPQDVANGFRMPVPAAPVGIMPGLPNGPGFGNPFGPPIPPHPGPIPTHLPPDAGGPGGFFRGPSGPPVHPGSGFHGIPVYGNPGVGSVGTPHPIIQHILNLASQIAAANQARQAMVATGGAQPYDGQGAAQQALISILHNAISGQNPAY